MTPKILLIGRTKSLNGGVNVHVYRLSQYLKNDQINYILFDYKKIWEYRKIFYNYNKAHINVSNKLLRLLFVCLFRLLSKKVIVTFHGYYDFKNMLDKQVLILSNFNILLNRESLINANKIKNKSNHLIGAFIPPFSIERPLSVDDIDRLKNLKSKYEYIFCLNAKYALDEENEEIYQGNNIIQYFLNFNGVGLIFSDFTEYYRKKYGDQIDNIIFITEKHDFFAVFEFADFLLRYTTKDGDSLSVKEALYYGIPVIASDCVSRPQSVITIKRLIELESLDLEKIKNSKIYKKPINNYSQIKELYFTDCSD